MPRFFCPLPLTTGALVSLPEAVARHLHVLRLAEGAALTLFNGDGGAFAATLDRLDKRQAVALVGDFCPGEAELPFALTLAQGLPEAAKMDWIIEKAVELGVAAIQPLAAQRSVVKLAAERAEKKLAHWQGIVVAASEQCGRNRLAQLAPMTEATRWFAAAPAGHRLLLTPRGDVPLGDWARVNSPAAVALLVGPEGGFSPAEEAAALAGGAVAVTMGPRILRTETAGLAAVATLSALWGMQ